MSTLAAAELVIRLNHRRGQHDALTLGMAVVAPEMPAFGVGREVGTGVPGVVRRG